MGAARAEGNEGGGGAWKGRTFCEDARQAVDALSDALQPLGAVVDCIHGSNVGKQRLQGGGRESGGVGWGREVWVWRMGVEGVGGRCAPRMPLAAMCARKPTSHPLTPPH